LARISRLRKIGAARVIRHQRAAADRHRVAAAADFKTLNHGAARKRQSADLEHRLARTGGVQDRSRRAGANNRHGARQDERKRFAAGQIVIARLNLDQVAFLRGGERRADRRILARHLERQPPGPARSAPKPGGRHNRHRQNQRNFPTVCLPDAAVH
jgi:hypothetical protein